VLDSERSSLPGARPVALNVELFYFFELREKTGPEAFAKKSLRYLVNPEPLIILIQTSARVRHVPGARPALWNQQYLE
jgi:hypothetical protein